MSSLRNIFLYCIVFIQTSCSTLDNPAVDTFKDAFNIGHSLTREPQFDPRFNYLYVTLKSHSTYLAGSPVSEPVEHWYSAKSDEITLTQGRIIDIHGTLTEWHRVRFTHLPSWQSLLNHIEPVIFSRIRDQMPGYLVDEKEQLRLTPLTKAPILTLRFHNANQLIWFEETNLTNSQLQPSFYALTKSNSTAYVVFTYTCLAPHYCLSLEQIPRQVIIRP
ncbi:MAG TPA: hypothetical protein PLQ34_09625 [Ferrovaceae bacterium]|nr:hypothetical protein [Ferrovaceae bacterium]